MPTRQLNKDLWEWISWAFNEKRPVTGVVFSYDNFVTIYDTLTEIQWPHTGIIESLQRMSTLSWFIVDIWDQVSTYLPAILLSQAIGYCTLKNIDEEVQPPYLENQFIFMSNSWILLQCQDPKITKLYFVLSSDSDLEWETLHPYILTLSFLIDLANLVFYQSLWLTSS